MERKRQLFWEPGFGGNAHDGLLQNKLISLRLCEPINAGNKKGENNNNKKQASILFRYNEGEF